MKLNLVVTGDGFKPATDDDFEQKKTLKRGTIVSCTIKESRNYLFHKKYFALINCAWEYLTEAQQEFFRNDAEVFRKAVEIAAGHCERIYSISRREWLEVPKSIAFDKLSECDFGSLYEKVKNVLYTNFIPEENQKEFEEQLRWF